MNYVLGKFKRLDGVNVIVLRVWMSKRRKDSEIKYSEIKYSL